MHCTAKAYIAQRWPPGLVLIRCRQHLALPKHAPHTSSDMERYGMPRSEVAFSNLIFSYLAMKVVFCMDKEHLREGRDSRQSGYQEIIYVAACNLLLKREEPCNTWVLTITGRSGEISRINNGKTFPACCFGQITCVCNKQVSRSSVRKKLFFSAGTYGCTQGEI